MRRARPLECADATNFARERGGKIIAIADSVVSPVAAQANICILAPNTSLSLFPSILPAMATAQALVQLMIAHGGEETLAEVANSEAQLRKFSVYTPQD